jgi:peptide/nickel transport system permease protein
MLAIAIVRIPFYVRLARGQTLVVRQFTYVQAARTFGASRWHLIRWHILRNALPPLIVQASLDIGSAILMAATLGFIGLVRSSRPPNGGDGGRGRNYVLDQWWYCAFPGAAILPPWALTCLATVSAICWIRNQEETVMTEPVLPLKTCT